MFLMLDALADGGVWAGIPKDLALRMIAQTMMVYNSHNINCTTCTVKD